MVVSIYCLSPRVLDLAAYRKRLEASKTQPRKKKFQTHPIIILRPHDEGPGGAA